MTNLAHAVSVVGLGCNNFGGRLDETGARQVITAALDTGINFFDTADTYGDKGGSELILGRALKGIRGSVVIASKFGYRDVDMGYGSDPKGSRKYLLKAVNHSLRRLRTDYLDILYLHSPDPVTPIAETLSSLEGLVAEGVIHAFGLSNVSACQIELAMEVSNATRDHRLAFVQNRYSVLERGAERTVLPLCAQHSLYFVPYWPLENGVLTGKVNDGGTAPPGSRIQSRRDEVTQARLRSLSRLRRWSTEHGYPILDTAIGYLNSNHPVLSVIAGAMTADQVRQNASCGEVLFDETRRQAIRDALSE